MADVRQIAKLRDRGESWEDIAKLLKCHKETARRRYADAVVPYLTKALPPKKKGVSYLILPELLPWGDGCFLSYIKPEARQSSRRPVWCGAYRTYRDAKLAKQVKIMITHGLSDEEDEESSED